MSSLPGWGAGRVIDARRAVDREGRWRVTARALIPLGSLLASAAMALATPLPAIGPAVLLALAALAAAAWPDTPAVLALTLAHVLAWLMLVPRPTGPADLVPALLAAIALTGVHLAAAAVSVWPPGTEIPPLARRRWAVRAGVVALAAVVVTAVAAALLEFGVPGSRVLTALAIIGLCAAALAGYRWSDTDDRRPDG